MKATADGSMAFDYLPYFPLHLNNLSTASVEYGTADFSAMTSIGKAEEAIAHLKAAKVAELSEDYRELFRTKLAVFVGRPELPKAAEAAA